VVAVIRSGGRRLPRSCQGRTAAVGGRDGSFPSAESSADEANRDRGRWQRPEQDGEFADLPVGMQTQVVDPLDVLAVDPGVADEKARVLNEELLCVLEIVEHIEDDLGDRGTEALDAGLVTSRS
jgi:hypothetical protein